MADGLAILGGRPVLPSPLRPYRSFCGAERDAAVEVIEKGCLSGFLGSWGEAYHGGERVRRLEEEWGRRFRTAHAVSVNSATSGLIAAMGAVGISPGDEVIVPPLTMSATVVAPLFYGGIPVFVDVEPETFCLDVDLVKARLSPRTRAVLAVNLFGHPARLHDLRALCDSKGIHLVEDNAQGPLAMEGERYAGAIGHIGVYSLNVHKHIQAGEGGICVTDDPDLARRLRLIRNHAENAVEPLGLDPPVNLVGFNFRMTELTAAVALEQLRRIDAHVDRRIALAEALTEGARGLEGLTPPVVRPGCRHVYYLWALRCDERALGISREAFSRALAAEGFPHSTGYVRPLYHLPVFQRRIAIGRNGYPFSLGAPDYARERCPFAERLYERDLLCFEPCAYDVDPPTRDRLIEALRKVHRHRDTLARSIASR